MPTKKKSDINPVPVEGNIIADYHVVSPDGKTRCHVLISDAYLPKTPEEKQRRRESFNALAVKSYEKSYMARIERGETPESIEQRRLDFYDDSINFFEKYKD